MAIGALVDKAFNAGTSALQNKRNKKATEQERRRNLALIKELDWEPMYASDTVPTYQKTKSPIARSYLESMLAGNNPNSTFSGAPNAKLTKQRQQASQDAMFGTMDQRIAQQRAADLEQPYKVQTPTRPVVGKQAQSAMWTAENTPYADKGINQNLHETINGLGRGKMPGVSGSDIKGGIGAMTEVAYVKGLSAAYGGPDAAAEAVRRYGSVEEAMRNAPGRKK